MKVKNMIGKFQRLGAKAKPAIVQSVTAVSFMGASAYVSAATAPTTPGTLGYTIYDLFINKIYGSGGGYAAGVLMLLWAFTKVKGDWREAAYIGVGATGVLLIPSIATALGAVVN
ncbi:MAG: hypothetical protein RPS47_17755 [Colwellia sp.]|jgi:hypothetical protein